MAAIHTSGGGKCWLSTSAAVRQNLPPTDAEPTLLKACPGLRNSPACASSAKQNHRQRSIAISLPATKSSASAKIWGAKLGFRRRHIGFGKIHPRRACRRNAPRGGHYHKARAAERIEAWSIKSHPENLKPENASKFLFMDLPWWWRRLRKWNRQDDRTEAALRDGVLRFDRARFNEGEVDKWLPSSNTATTSALIRRNAPLYRATFMDSLATPKTLQFKSLPCGNSISDAPPRCTKSVWTSPTISPSQAFRLHPRKRRYAGFLTQRTDHTTNWSSVIAAIYENERHHRHQRNVVVCRFCPCALLPSVPVVRAKTCLSRNMQLHGYGKLRVYPAYWIGMAERHPLIADALNMKASNGKNQYAV